LFVLHTALHDAIKRPDLEAQAKERSEYPEVILNESVMASSNISLITAIMQTLSTIVKYSNARS
jgi:hypothetical protein